MIGEAFAVALALQSPASACLRTGDLIAGEFRYVESRHPNGTNLRYGVVKTAQPMCVVAQSAESGELFIVQGRWVQVSWSDDQIGGQPVPGDQVEIAGECFEPHTAWHLGDIICINARLISRDPM